MKIQPLITLVLLITLVACKKQNSAQKADTHKEDTPITLLTYNGKKDNSKHIVFVSGDEEYRSEEALPQLAKILSKHHGFMCTVLFAQDPTKLGLVNANYTKNIPGLSALDSADLMVIFTRFRDLPDEQMRHIDNYLQAGKPVVGIRTATHAFNFQKDSLSNYSYYGNYYSGDNTNWHGGFGQLVLGQNWLNHHGYHKHQSTRGVIAAGAIGQPISNGLTSGAIWGPTDVYGVHLPLPGDSEPIILGQVVNRQGEYDENDIFFGMKPSDSVLASENNEGLKVNDVLMPIAWTKTYQLPNGKPGKAFTSTIGAAPDMLNEGVRRLLVNGVFWAMDLDIPEKANVDLVGIFQPEAYGFKTDEFWLNKKLYIKNLQ